MRWVGGTKVCFVQVEVHSPSKCLVRFGLYGVKWPIHHTDQNGPKILTGSVGSKLVGRWSNKGQNMVHVVIE